MTRAVPPEPEASLHVFPVSHAARMRLALRNLEAVLEEQRRHIAGLRVALGVVGASRPDDGHAEPPRARDRAARP